MPLESGGDTIENPELKMFSMTSLPKGHLVTILSLPKFHSNFFELAKERLTTQFLDLLPAPAVNPGQQNSRPNVSRSYF